MRIFCRYHAEQMAVVEPGAKFVTLSPRWRAHHAVRAQVGRRANSFTNLRVTTRPVVEAEGCSKCGPRMLHVPTILAAFEEGRDKISL